MREDRDADVYRSPVAELADHDLVRPRWHSGLAMGFTAFASTLALFFVLALRLGSPTRTSWGILSLFALSGTSVAWVFGRSHPRARWIWGMAIGPIVTVLVIVGMALLGSYATRAGWRR